MAQIARLENEIRIARDLQLQQEMRQREAENIAVQTSLPSIHQEINPLMMCAVSQMEIQPVKDQGVEAKVRDTATSPMVEEKSTDPKVKDGNTEPWLRDNRVQTSFKSHREIIDLPRPEAPL